MSRTAPAPAPVSPPLRRSPASRARRLRPWPWDDAPLRTKVHAMVSVSLIGGLLLGTLEAQLGHHVWPMMLGVSALMLVTCSLANKWIAAPLDRLVTRLERLGRSRERAPLRRLPVTRNDELGRIARAVHHLGESAVRHQTEAVMLRKTLDHRTAEATRRATRQLERLAMRDPLTDLGNRRCLEENLEPLVALARDNPELELLCILLDVDNFKPLNDTLGHAAGDEVLVFLSSLIRGCTRDDDLTVRLGGDEFVVLVPTHDLGRARQFSELVRSLFRQQTRTMYPDGPAADLSMGVAALKRDGCRDGEALLAAADANLYRAKRSGKGQTTGVGEGAEGPRGQGVE